MGMNRCQGRCARLAWPARQPSALVFTSFHGGSSGCGDVCAPPCDRHRHHNQGAPSLIEAARWLDCPSLSANDSERQPTQTLNVPCRSLGMGRPRSRAVRYFPRPHTKNADRLRQYLCNDRIAFAVALRTRHIWPSATSRRCRAERRPRPIPGSWQQLLVALVIRQREAA